MIGIFSSTKAFLKPVTAVLLILGFCMPMCQAQDRGARFCGNVRNYRAQQPIPRDLRKEANTAQNQYNLNVEKKLINKISEDVRNDKLQSAEGARDIIDLARFYKNTDRFTEAVYQYERAIEVLQKLPEEKLLLQSAELSKQSVQERVRKTIELLSKKLAK